MVTAWLLEMATAVMTVAFGPDATTTGTSWTAGFDFPADGEGGLHDHFELSIASGDGEPAPDDGVYLLPLQIAGKSGSIGGTDVFWFVMNLNMDEEVHDAAIDWVDTHLASTPCAADLDDDRDVDFDDLLLLLTSWGPCPR